MWSTPGYLMSAKKSVDKYGNIVDMDSKDDIFRYRPVSVDATPDGKISRRDTEKSNIYMLENTDPDIYFTAMENAVIGILSEIPDIN